MGFILWSGWGSGITLGDGDQDICADEIPSAILFTTISALVIGTLTCIAVGSNDTYLAALTDWLWKL